MQQLSGQDAMFLHAEIDGLPQHIGGVSIYDQSTAPSGKVRFKQILEMLEKRLHLSPIFRRKLAFVPLGLGRPYWVEDPDFDLEYHVEWNRDREPQALLEQVISAIARALFNSPRLILADEPTSALDQKNRKAFMEILMDLCDAYQSTLIFVSHDPTLASDFDRIDVLGDINKAGA